MCIIHINDTINLFIISLETLFDKVFVHSFDGNVFSDFLLWNKSDVLHRFNYFCRLNFGHCGILIVIKM